MSLHKKTIALVTLLTLTAPAFLLSMDDKLPSDLKWKSVEFNNKTTQIAKNPENSHHIYEKDSNKIRIIKFSIHSTNKKSIIFNFLPNIANQIHIITPGKNGTFSGKTLDAEKGKNGNRPHMSNFITAAQKHALFTHYYETLNKKK